MENQHRKISGYRELTQEEIDLMNEIEENGKELKELINKLRSYIDESWNEECSCEIMDILNQSYRWIEIGATDLQTGLMALTIAVAKPEFF